MLSISEIMLQHLNDLSAFRRKN